MNRRAFLKQVAAGVALSALPAPVAVSPLGTASVPVVVTPSSYCGVIYGALMLMNEQPIPTEGRMLSYLDDAGEPVAVEL